MTRTQTDVFVESEGSEWFRRNKSSLERYDVATDPIAVTMGMYGIRPKRLAELGAANGVRAATLASAFSCEATAVEPSAEAVADGRRRFPHVTYVQSAIHEIDLNASFDVVIVNFVLHWVDRRLLLASIARVDALVAEGGYLLIGDFFPSAPTRVPYHHLPGQEVFTYKQDYGALFAASQLYDVIAVLGGAHGTGARTATASDRDRAAVWLLRKTTTGRYALG